jgi:hypothetical protein
VLHDENMPEAGKPRVDPLTDPRLKKDEVSRPASRAHGTWLKLFIEHSQDIPKVICARLLH